MLLMQNMACLLSELCNSQYSVPFSVAELHVNLGGAQAPLDFLQNLTKVHMFFSQAPP